MNSTTFQNPTLRNENANDRKPAVAPWPFFSEEELEAVAGVLRSGKVNYWTGEQGRMFEMEFASSAGCKYGVALANGTLALEVALYALGIGPGDEVITTSRTFIASASCAVMRGARPVCVDVDRESQNITPETIRSAITPRTKAIIAVHLAGWPCDMDSISQLAKEHNLKVIEDCAQATGATYKGKPVGSLSDAAAFSFCQDKIITTGGEGGMLTTNLEQVWRKAWSFKDHGKSYEAVYHRSHAPGFRWLHEEFGTNWRMTEMQSAIGRVQMTKLGEWIRKRRQHAALLTDRFSKIPAFRVTVAPPSVEHAYYKYYVFVQPSELRENWTRDRIMEAISKQGVPCFSGSCSEIYLEKAFPAEWMPAQRLPVAKELGENSLMFLVHPTLSLEDMNLTAEIVEAVMAKAVR